MSILIKGMRMPKNCIKCPMQFGGMCYVMPADVDESRVAPTVEEAWKQGKPDWCPLIEIPESHGDLIDRDALLDMVRDVNTDYYCEVLGVTVEDIDSVPTVIEAEGSEDDEYDFGICNYPRRRGGRQMCCYGRK